MNGFTGDVSLTLSGLSETQASWSISPTVLTGSSTLTVRTTSSTPRGTYTLRVTGTSGSLVHQATARLIVR